jgi:hypothetical protein
MPHTTQWLPVLIVVSFSIAAERLSAQNATQSVTIVCRTPVPASANPSGLRLASKGKLVAIRDRVWFLYGVTEFGDKDRELRDTSERYDLKEWSFFAAWRSPSTPLYLFPPTADRTKRPTPIELKGRRYVVAAPADQVRIADPKSDTPSSNRAAAVWQLGDLVTTDKADEHFSRCKLAIQNEHGERRYLTFGQKSKTAGHSAGVMFLVEAVLGTEGPEFELQEFTLDGR